MKGKRNFHHRFGKQPCMVKPGRGNSLDRLGLSVSRNFQQNSVNRRIRLKTSAYWQLEHFCSGCNTFKVSIVLRFVEFYRKLHQMLTRKFLSRSVLFPSFNEFFGTLIFGESISQPTGQTFLSRLVPPHMKPTKLLFSFLNILRFLRLKVC